jgi:hypothetical protein
MDGWMDGWIWRNCLQEKAEISCMIALKDIFFSQINPFDCSKTPAEEE